NANTLFAGAPDDLIARHQRRQIGPQMAAKDLAGLLALLRRNLYLYAEVSNDQTGLLRPQVAALKLFDHARFATRCARGALFLDFLDAPVLSAVELAFGHLCGYPGWKAKDSSTREFSTAGLYTALCR